MLTRQSLPEVERQFRTLAENGVQADIILIDLPKDVFDAFEGQEIESNRPMKHWSQGGVNVTAYAGGKS
jgi:hypothetical protein